jgi:hypothetical protein
LEWGEVGGSTDHNVVTQYYPWHDLHPFAILLAFKYFLDCLKNQCISSLNCSVGLRVIYRCKGDLRPDLMIEILEHSTIEILSTVDRDLLRNSVTTDDILLEKILDGVEGYNCYWFRFNPFGEVLNCGNDEGVVSLCSCKFSHDIDALLLQGPCWSY